MRLATSRRSRRRAAATRSSAWATVRASGFSTITCLPASRAARACGKWRNGGVAMYTPATSSRRGGSPPSFTVSNPERPAPAAAAVAPGAATAAAVLPGLGLVHRQRPAVELGPVEGRDGLVPAVAHLDEREPPRPAGLPVHDQLHLGDRAVLGERLPELVLG